MTRSIDVTVASAIPRPGCFAAGIGTVLVAWGVLPWLPSPPFATHMTMHMLVVAVAAPLLAFGVAGGAVDPVHRLAPRGDLGRDVGARCSPVVASMVELVLVWAWHAPALHHAARHHLGARAVEQGTFLAAGLYLWVAAFGGSPAERRARAPAGIAGLLLTSMHMTLLGALLALTTRTLFGGHGAHAGSLSPLHDQHVGGAIMLLMGGLAYLAGALVLMAEVLRPARSR